MIILIVDDQEDVVTSIENGMDWKPLGVEAVYTATDAETAKHIIGTCPVDIMLCDIEMPGKNGLELFEWVRENGYATECVFLTSHADFNYAQKAIQLGGFDYILQPARFEEIERVLRKVCGKIVQDRKMDQLRKKQDMLEYQQDIVLEGIFDKLFSAENDEAERMFLRLPELFQNKYLCGVFYIVGIQLTRWRKNSQEWNGDLIRLVLRNVLEEIFADNRCELLISRAGEFDFIAMFYGDMSEFNYELLYHGLCAMHEFVNKKMEFEVAVYIGGRMENSLHDMVHILAQMLNDNVMKTSQVFESRNLKPVPEIDLDRMNYKAWSDWLSEAQGNCVKAEIVKYLDTSRLRGTMSLELLRRIHYYFTKAFFTALEKLNVNGEDAFGAGYSYDAYMDAYKSYEALIYALDFAIDYLKDCAGGGLENRIEAAKKYVSDNISKNVTRSEVAAHVFLNEEYFSRLFKKETGYVFKDYVTMEKLEFAKQLLENTRFSISIVGSKAGYDNFSYFSKVFKKYEGVSPQEYRQLHCKAAPNQ